MRLVLGSAACTRVLEDADRLLGAYRTDDGLRYLDYVTATPRDRVVPDDLAVTILINSRATSRAFKSVQDYWTRLDLASVPTKDLEQTTAAERDSVADIIEEFASWPGFGASLATKVLHKKRQSLVPILDNEAIFGAYMNPAWPAQRARRDTVKSRGRIREALEWVFTDLTRRENAGVWPQLSLCEPKRPRLDLFDMVWWSYFRTAQPVTGRSE